MHEAERQRLIPSNPVDLVRAPRQEAKQVEAFTLQEAHAVDLAAEGRRLAALFRVAWRTGLRLGEALALTWVDIDFEAGTIAVRRKMVHVDGVGHVVQTPKMERGVRSVAMSASVTAELEAHRERQDQERGEAGSGWQDASLVFCTSLGRPLTPRNVTRDWHAVRKAAGVPEHGFHALRHTYATLAKRAGIPIEDIADALGHESPAFTAKRYAHVTADGRRDSAARFEAFTGGA